MSLILLLAALLIAAGSVLVARALQAQGQAADVENRLRQFTVMRKRRQPEPEAEEIESTGMWGWLEPTGKERLKLIAQLQEAGFSRVTALQNFAVLRLVISVAVTVSTYIWASSNAGLPLMIQITLSMLGFTVAYVGAGQWLTIMANSRKNRVRQEFAFVLDLFVLTVEAGLSLDQSIRHVARHAGRAARAPAPFTPAGGRPPPPHRPGQPPPQPPRARSFRRGPRRVRTRRPAPHAPRCSHGPPLPASLA